MRQKLISLQKWGEYLGDLVLYLWFVYCWEIIVNKMWHVQMSLFLSAKWPIYSYRHLAANAKSTISQTILKVVRKVQTPSFPSIYYIIYELPLICAINRKYLCDWNSNHHSERAWAQAVWSTVVVAGPSFKFTTVKLKGPNKQFNH